MQNEYSPEQIIAELKIRFFDFREQAENRLGQLEDVLRTIFEAAGAQSIEEVLAQLKKEDDKEDENEG